MKKLASCSADSGLPDSLLAAKRDTPRIINIVNFIRLLEPRNARITQTVLHETVVKQLELMNRYDFPGTFLLQYDALPPCYQELFKTGGGTRLEIGGWWEITHLHVETAGIKWRGRYHANSVFSPPEELEKRVDVYMEKFKFVFGKYPTATPCGADTGTRPTTPARKMHTCRSEPAKGKSPFRSSECRQRPVFPSRRPAKPP